MADTQPPVSSEVGVASSKIEKTAPLTAAKSSPPESPKADHASRAPAADTDAQSETGLTNNEAVPIQWAQFEQALKLLGVCASFQLVSNSAGSSVTVEEVAMLSNCRSYFKKTLLNKPLSNSLHSAMTYLDGINPSGSLQYVIVGGSETPAISAVKMVLGEERSKEVRGDLSQPLDSTSLRNDGPINMEAKPEKIVWYDYGRLRFGVLNGDVVGVFADPVAESSRLKNPQQGNTLADDASSKTVDDSAPPKASVKTDDTALQAPEWLVGRWEGLTEEKNECALVFERNDKRIAQVFIHAGENINFGVRAYTIDARSNMVRLPDDTFTAILVEANKLHVKANYGGSSYGAKVEIDMTMTRVKQSIP